MTRRRPRLPSHHQPKISPRLPASNAVAAKLTEAVALHQRGELARAEALYGEVLAQVPGQFDALHLLGVVQCQRGRHEAAITLIQKAIRIDPNYAQAHSNLGAALRELNRLQEALASFDRALALQPASPESLNNRGSVLALLKRYDEALASLNRAVALKPDYAEAFSNRANALEKLNRFEEALASCDRALAIKPGYPEAFNNGGNALRELQRPEEALARYDRALALKPDYPEALSNRGSALMDLKRFGAAAKCFEQLMEIAPAWDYAAGNLLSCHLYSCDWEKVAALTTRVSDAVERGEKVIAPFAFLAVSDSLAAQLQCSRTYSADRYPTSTKPVWTGQRYRHDRIRLAYLSADFREHATAYLMAGLFEAHDKRRFETTALSFGRDDRSGTRERLRRSFERFVDVSGKSDREIAQLIRDSEIDIAVDLKGFTTDCRAGILAHHPAPIQVSYLGYPGTLGADHIDYILADRRVIPPEDTAYYSEKIVYLPDTYQVNDSKRKIAEKAPTRAEATLSERAFVFCCFNNNYKIRPDVFDIWMRLLNKVEGSVLWLLEDNAAVSHNLQYEAKRRGVEPDRLVFTPRIDPEVHLARHRLADLFLDTLPYNAHTTASDALWAGLPVVTCLGRAFAGRVAGSLLNAVGLPELVTRSFEDYEALALQLATNPAVLSDVRAKLARNRTTAPLFDTDRFRRHVESAYIEMWERYQRAEQTACFSVESTP